MARARPDRDHGVMTNFIARRANWVPVLIALAGLVAAACGNGGNNSGY